ncbi:multifunctional acyl-CoA thioesterase I/protease I/lysophospholipase L1 [Candidatus Pantoea soli]|nr:multifunctional acyl-CoA thioesterase I/protease I/lysophospholipase L1 [Pantoea soli]
MMNRNNVFRWHYPFLLLVLLLVSRVVSAADTLLVLGDSLSAGYRMSASAAWPSLLDKTWQQQPRVINASISGDTAGQGLARLPALLKQHQPRWVLIELGGNDGLRGFPPADIARDLSRVIEQVKAADAQPLLMQIRLPANYGRRYTEAFSAIYPQLAQQYALPLIPFFMEQVYLKPEWMQQDGIHPNPAAQPFIAKIMAETLAPLVKQN